MEFGIHANMYELKMQYLVDIIRPFIENASNKLSGDYGGIIEHLWIDLELVENLCNTDGSDKYPFRFQKRVSGRSHFGLPPQPDYFNVGHFSIRPDFKIIDNINNKKIIPYFAQLIYNKLNILKIKSKRLGGFNYELFKNKYKEFCSENGIEIVIQ